ncbi:MAG: TolC family protein [Bacteroidota bacterium]
MKRYLILICSLMVSSAYAQERGLLTFSDAVKIALENNVILKRQKNQLSSIQAQKLNAKAQYLPSIGIQGSGSRNDGQQIDPITGNGTNIISDNFSGSISAGYSLFSGFSRWNNLKASDASFRSQTELAARTSQDVIANVANQFLQVLLDQELLKIAEANFENQNNIMTQIQSQVDLGARPVADKYNQEAIVKNNEVQVLRAKNDLQNDNSLLSQILQLDPSQKYELVIPNWNVDELTNLDEDLDKLYEIAMNNRSDVKQLDYQTESARFNMKSAASGYFPSIDLFVSYGSQYFSVQDDPEAVSFNTQFFDLNPSLSYGFSFSIPIFDRLNTYSRRTTAKVNFQNSMNDFDNVKKTALIEVQRAYQNFQNAILNYEATKIQLQSAEFANDTQKESYSLGVASLIELSQSNQIYVQGLTDLAQAKYTLLFQNILLNYALGTLKFEDIP